MGALSCPVARGCPLALPIAVADRPLLRRSRLEAHRRGDPSAGERGQQFLRREAADEGPLRGPNGRYSGPRVVLSNVYGRAFGQGNPLVNTPCMENDGVATQPQANLQILGPDNQPTHYSLGGGNACALTSWGTVERAFINALTTGEIRQTATTTR